ncbi:MAG TPA: class I SAM-dependent methyltransferase [Longimicrobiaceae bacterium]|nr:class I SAM-dependent methyltransferase [Longimicrobiaceae bacterium]
MQKSPTAPQRSVLDANPIVRQILVDGIVRDAAGTELPAGSNISIEHAEALRRAVLEQRPRTVLEVGMAYGTSSLVILTALDEIGEGGRLVTVDPYQGTSWQSIGRLNVERAGFAASHTLLEAPDYLALPKLLEDGLRVEMAYVDGMHTFDYTLLDFFYVDKMLEAGGLAGFNDCGMSAVDRVLKYVVSHRKYAEVPVVPRRYQGRNAAVSAVRRVLNRPTNDRYFRKLEEWEPAWNFYARF